MSSLSISILRLRDFRLLLLTRMLTSMALVSQAVIVGWQIYSLTRDPFMLGLTGLVEAVPAIACALIAGHIVDISRPHRVYMICISVLMLNMFFLTLVGGGFIEMPKHQLLLCLFTGIFISGLARSFIMPSAFALLPQIIPRKDLPASSSWLTSGFQIAAVGGPALAGLIYGGYGARGAWMLPAFLLLFAFIIICRLPTPTHAREARERESAVKSITDGWKFILGNSTLLPVMTLDMFAVLFGGAVAMLPAFADQVLHVGSEGLGALRAAPALGAVITALIFALYPMKNMSARRLMWMVAGFGLCMIGFGLSKYFWLSMFFLALSGAFDSVSMIVRGPMMQLLTPEHMRGRVSAVNSMFIISSNEIGAFESGLAAKIFGLSLSVVLGGIVTLGVVATTALAAPKFRKTVVNADEQL
jgi:MFS family permease